MQTGAGRPNDFLPLLSLVPCDADRSRKMAERLLPLLRPSARRPRRLCGGLAPILALPRRPCAYPGAFPEALRLSWRLSWRLPGGLVPAAEPEDRTTSTTSEA